jgi:hypothetical protein
MASRSSRRFVSFFGREQRSFDLMRVQINPSIGEGSSKLLHAVRGAPFRQFIGEVFGVVSGAHGRVHGHHTSRIAGILLCESPIAPQQRRPSSPQPSSTTTQQRPQSASQVRSSSAASTQSLNSDMQNRQRGSAQTSNYQRSTTSGGGRTRSASGGARRP